MLIYVNGKSQLLIFWLLLFVFITSKLSNNQFDYFLFIKISNYKIKIVVRLFVYLHIIKHVLNYYYFDNTKFICVFISPQILKYIETFFKSMMKMCY